MAPKRVNLLRAPVLAFHQRRRSGSVFAQGPAGRGHHSASGQTNSSTGWRTTSWFFFGR
jgi:hypothetical protein